MCVGLDNRFVIIPSFLFNFIVKIINTCISFSYTILLFLLQNYTQASVKQHLTSQVNSIQVKTYQVTSYTTLRTSLRTEHNYHKYHHRYHSSPSTSNFPNNTGRRPSVRRHLTLQVMSFQVKSFQVVSFAIFSSD